MYVICTAPWVSLLNPGEIIVIRCRFVKPALQHQDIMKKTPFFLKESDGVQLSRKNNWLNELYFGIESTDMLNNLRNGHPFSKE